MDTVVPVSCYIVCCLGDQIYCVTLNCCDTDLWGLLNNAGIVGGGGPLEWIPIDVHKKVTAYKRGQSAEFSTLLTFNLYFVYLRYLFTCIQSYIKDNYHRSLHVLLACLAQSLNGLHGPGFPSVRPVWTGPWTHVLETGRAAYRTEMKMNGNEMTMRWSTADKSIPVITIPGSTFEFSILLLLSVSVFFFSTSSCEISLINAHMFL